MCGALGIMLMRKFHAPDASVWVWSGGGLLAVLGVISPPVIRPLYVALMRLTFPIGWCVSHVVLAIMYFLLLTPIGFLVRRFHDPMERRFEPAADSYWFPRQEAHTDRYFRQV